MEFRRVLFRSKGMAGKACHAFGSTTQFGLTQALGLMFNFSNFVPKEPNLARAVGLLLIEIVTFVSVSFALSGLGVDVEGPIFASLFLFNLVPAYFLYRAAKSKGRTALFFGLVSLIPAGALFSFFVLSSEENT